MIKTTTLLVSFLAALPLCAQDLRPPVRLEADGKPIDTEVGHAAPYVVDFDGDGVRDLLVGQFGEGKLKIFRNVGTNESPKFAAAEWFKAGDGIAKVPAG